MNKKKWGGKRPGCGRKRIERGSEIKAIRDKNAKLRFPKQPEGTLANPRFGLWRKAYYEGGF